MPKFTDAKNREWNVEITVHAARAVKEKLGLELVAMKDGEALTRLLTDPLSIVDALFILVADQAREAGIDEEKFGSGFNGDAIERGTDCLVHALIAFFPPQRRDLLQRMWTQAKAIQEREIEAVTKYLDSPELEAEIEALLQSRHLGTAQPAGRGPSPA